MAWVEAGTLDDIPAGRVKLLLYEPDELRIAVCNVDGEYYAIERAIWRVMRSNARATAHASTCAPGTRR